MFMTEGHITVRVLLRFPNATRYLKIIFKQQENITECLPYVSQYFKPFTYIN